jgi:hypothetical protein
MKQIVLKKSELAMLKGSGHTHEMVAEKFGVKESEVKDAMMTFGLSKAKPKAKKEAAYAIVLDDDMLVERTAPVSESLGNNLPESNGNVTEKAPVTVEL